MKSWKYIKKPEAAAAFLEEYRALCAKHGMQVGYEVSRAGDDAWFQLESLDPGEIAASDVGDTVHVYGEHEPNP